jgi:hypothetical protein
MLVITGSMLMIPLRDLYYALCKLMLVLKTPFCVFCNAMAVSHTCFQSAKVVAAAEVQLRDRYL